MTSFNPLEVETVDMFTVCYNCSGRLIKAKLTERLTYGEWDNVEVQYPAKVCCMCGSLHAVRPTWQVMALVDLTKFATPEEEQASRDNRSQQFFFIWHSSDGENFEYTHGIRDIETRRLVQAG